MRSNWLGRALAVVLNVGLLAGAAWLARTFGPLVEPRLHGAVFTGAAVLSTVAFTLGGLSLARLDKLLDTADAYDAVRTERIYRYIMRARRRAIAIISIGVVAVAGVAGAAYVIKDSPKASHLAATEFGYLCLAALVLVGIRLGSLYLAADPLRLKLNQRIKSEEKRAATLKAMRRPEAIGDFSDTTSQRVGFGA